MGSSRPSEAAQHSSITRPEGPSRTALTFLSNIASCRSAASRNQPFANRGQLGETLELMFYYVKCGNDVTLEFGDMDETFYNSMGSMFGSIMKKLSMQADLELTATWLDRLENKYQRVADTGWGYGDELGGYLEDLRSSQK